MWVANGFAEGTGDELVGGLGRGQAGADGGGVGVFGMFSFVPLLYIVLTVAGLIFQDTTLVSPVMSELVYFLGPDTVTFLRQLLSAIAGASERVAAAFAD